MTPALPDTSFVKVQVIGSLPTASVTGRPVPSVAAPLQSSPAIAAGSPLPTLSVKLAASRVTASVADVFFTVTVKFTGPPGSGRLAGTGVFVTTIEDGRSSIDTSAQSV